jgi:hypothetical protein
VKSAKHFNSDIVINTLEVFSKGTGLLAAIEKEKDTTWPIERVFFISNELPEKRGSHAHKTCKQLFVCISGQIEIRCHDGKSSKIFTFLGLGKTLFVPPGIWVDIEMASNASLGVITDQKYIESDYIRDWDEFLIFRGTA